MNKVILITGSSSGIGKETVKLFQTKNWKVAATMRTPEKADDLQRIADIECIRLDVTDVGSIKSAIQETIDKFGQIDAIVNNAGYGLVGTFEAATPEQIEKQFQTNVFGLMNVCREILPHFRERKRGTIVNVASVGGRITFPLYSLYHATKWAVEGFSESLHYEIRPFNIKVKIIEPGPIKTDFYERSQDLTTKEELDAYDGYVEKVFPRMQRSGENAPDGSLVAEVIYNAVTDGSWKMRYPANSRMLLTLRRILPNALFYWLIRQSTMR
ncbi:MAG: SDR family oxidoreductase [Pyrinomonadaceae bacterium]|nr:SDR family oxidoreductase [Pyrinomonadaceae bacterium]